MDVIGLVEARVRQLAAKISDEALCQSCLESVPENAHILALSQLWRQ
jgi:hypothetical protein